MAGRLEPVVHSWIKWVTWGIVITINREKPMGCFIYFLFLYIYIYFIFYLFIFFF